MSAPTHLPTTHVPAADVPTTDVPAADAAWRPAEAVAGLLAAGALFAGLVELVYRPFRIAPVALILVLMATIMSKRQQRLIGLAAAVVGVCFVIGAALTVITKHPLY